MVLTNPLSTVEDSLLWVKSFNQPYVLTGSGTSSTSTVVPVLFEITTGKRPHHEEAPPVCLCIVLDISGSMDGERIHFAKEAIKMTVERLREKDLLYLITYNSRVNVVFKDEAPSKHKKEEIFQKVESIHANHSTNMEIGLEMAKKVLLESTLLRQREIKNKRIFLFSDGQVNEGKQKNEELFEIAEAICKSGINITSFGIGDSFNEELMKGLAKHGAGDFYYLKDEEDIKPRVYNGLNVLMEMIGLNSTLNVTTKDGCLIKTSDGLTSVLMKPVGDVSEDDLRTVMLEFQLNNINDLKPTSGQQIEIASWRYVFCTASGGEEKSVEGSCFISLTHDPELAKKQFDEVTTALAIKESGENDKKVSEWLQSGLVQEAIDLKEKTIANLKAVQSIDKSRVVGLLLQRAEKLLENMRLKLDEGEDDYASEAKEAHWEGYSANIVHRKCF